MTIALGIVVGAILGAVALGWSGSFTGAFVGFIVVMVWRARAQACAPRTGGAAGVPVFPERGGVTLPGAPVPPASAPAAGDIAARLGAIEARLARLEERLSMPADIAAASAARTAAAEVRAAAAEPARTIVDVRAPEPVPEAAPELPTATAGAVETGVPAGFRRTPEGTLEPVADPLAARAALTPPADGATATASEHGPVQPAFDAPVPQASPNPLWAWFTSGNVLTRVGVVALFLGVGFLLKYLADIVTIPLTVRLAGVALGGVALIVLGARLAPTRPGYGVSLEGAGAGILYLTTYAALRLYDVIAPGPAFAVLAAVSALTVCLAARANSQPLAALAIAGGFLAPFLVATSSGSPALLLGYFLVLNVAILALALVKSWRALNVLGFVFTFVLGALWGHRFYRPAHFATVEPFLIAYFLFYLAIAILYARRAPLEARRPVDGMLVFGVPLVAFALQAALVRDTRYGVAISALALAALYGVLALVLRKRAEQGFALLARAFVVLAVIFVTVAIPFALDPQWTSAWWAIEAAAVYWIGCVQRQPLARGAALLLELAAALAFVNGSWGATGPIFANAHFMGAILIALAALATAWLMDRHADALAPLERPLAPLLVAWGTLWWMGAGALEIDRVVANLTEAHAMLAYATASVVAMLGLARALRWWRLAGFGTVLLPVMIGVAFTDWWRAHSTLGENGWILWPAAWVAQWMVLRALERHRPDGEPAAPEPWLHAGHAASAIALVAWLGWEASEWVGRTAAAGSVWLPCAAVWPAIFYLVAMAHAPERARWPLARFRDAYVRTAGTVVATLACLWFVLVNVLSPGGAPPLPYAPLLNPLDLTLVAVVAAVFAWCRRATTVDERTLYGWLGVAIFLLVNAIVFRTVHQWGGVPWRFGALAASKTLQAALTLTWTVTALPLMVVAHRRAIRPLWMVGAALLAVVVGKLFLLDLASLSGLPRIVAFIGVGLLLLLIGYLAPLPPARQESHEGDA